MKPILGCEVYVANGSRLTKSGVPGRDRQPSRAAGRRTKTGYHNLIKLVSSGYTEGFYYKPRIDKDLLASHAEGLIGLSSCLKGEVATNLMPGAAPQGARRPRRPSFRDILGAGSFFLEMQYQGIDEQRLVNHRAPADRARSSACRSSAPTTSTTCTQGDDRPHDVLLCIGTGKNVQDEHRLKYHGDQFFLKTADADGPRLRGRSRRRCSNTHGHRRAVRRRPERDREPPARTSTCRRPYSVWTSTSSTWSGRGSPIAEEAAAEALDGAGRRWPIRWTPTRPAWPTRSTSSSG